MVFCIDSEKNKELSKILSAILGVLKDDDEVEALLMNSYLIHIPYRDLFEPSPLIDGINIQLVIVVNDHEKIVPEELQALKVTCLEKLNYNILFTFVGTGALREDNKSVKMLLNDGDVLFDKKGRVTSIKNRIFIEKRENVIEYEPKLNITGGNHVRN